MTRLQQRCLGERASAGSGLSAWDGSLVRGGGGILTRLDALHSREDWDTEAIVHFGGGMFLVCLVFW